MEHLKVKLNVSFYIALAVYFLLGQFVQFACYLLAMFMHETAHYMVAKRLFYKCSQMELSCFGAVLYGDFNYACKRDLILIALAGPVCNLVVALLTISLWWISPQTYYFTYDFVWANLGMATVNLLPIYPLDGGKVLCGILQNFFDDNYSVKLVKIFAFLVAILLMLAFALGWFLGHFLPALCLCSLFVFCASFSKGTTRYLRRSYLENYTERMVKGVEKKTLVFDADATVSSVAKRMIGGSLYDVELWHKGNLVKRFSFYQLDSILKTANPNDKLFTVVEKL